MCRGVVVAGGPLNGKKSLAMTKDDSAMQSAVDFLEENGYENVRERAQVRLAAERGQEALMAEEFLAATEHFTEALESPLAASLTAELAAADAEAPQPPTFPSSS